MIPQQCSMVIWPVNQIAVSLKHIFQRFLLHKTEPRKCQSSENALAPIWRATSQLPNSAICLPPILYLSLRGLGICEIYELTFSPQHSAGGNPGTGQQCTVAQEDLQNKLCPVCQVQNSDHTFFSVFPKSASLVHCHNFCLHLLIGADLFPALLRVAFSKLQTILFIK